MSPEFLKSGLYESCQSTVWAVRMILVELLSSYMAFNRPELSLTRDPRISEFLSARISSEINYKLVLGATSSPGSLFIPPPRERERERERERRCVALLLGVGAEAKRPWKGGCFRRSDNEERRCVCMIIRQVDWGEKVKESKERGESQRLLFFLCTSL